MEASPTPPPPPPPAPQASPKRIEVGKVISETFDMYGKNAGPLLGSAVVVFVISGVLQGFLRDEGGFILSLIASIVGLIASALYTGFVVNLVADIRADGRRDLSAGEMMSMTTPVILPLIGAAILAGIGIGIGFILLIIPGLFLLTIWSVVGPAIVVERTGVIGAFGRSHELVKGDGWSVFGTIVVAFLIVVIASAIATAIGAAIGLGGLIVGLTLVGILTAPITALVASILFFDLGGGQGAVSAGEPAPPAPAV
jgi:MFS family permease